MVTHLERSKRRLMNNKTNHTFVICAYKESPYLEECIQSLQAQTVPSQILMVTSTPNEWIKKCSEKYGVPLKINEGMGGIAQDWNFAYSQCGTPYLTIAHQDDIYRKEYTKHLTQQINSDELIIFSDYGEIRGNKHIEKNRNLIIKRIMLWSLRFSWLQKNIWLRRRILSLGNPICCPGVLYNKKNLPDQIFNVHFRSNVDWEAWEKLSKKKGRFVYVPEVLMEHRIHNDSETSATIHDNLRTKEDCEMFEKFWPLSIAKKLAKIYAKSEQSNEIQ